MRKVSTVLAAVIIAVFTLGVSAQNPAPSSQQQAQAEKPFAMGNTLMEQRKPGEALVHYKQALAILPNEPCFTSMVISRTADTQLTECFFLSHRMTTSARR